MPTALSIPIFIDEEFIAVPEYVGTIYWYQPWYGYGFPVDKPSIVLYPHIAVALVVYQHLKTGRAATARENFIVEPSIAIHPHIAVALVVYYF